MQEKTKGQQTTKSECHDLETKDTRPEPSQAAMKMPAEKDALLRISEVAARLKISKWTVYHWVSIGRLKSIKLGGRLRRVREDDLERFIKGDSE